MFRESFQVRGKLLLIKTEKSYHLVGEEKEMNVCSKIFRLKGNFYRDVINRISAFSSANGQMFTIIIQGFLNETLKTR